MIALIPAKSYSSRLPNKNVKLLNKKPLIYYSIKAALKSKMISRVIVSTDSKKIMQLAKSFGAEAPFLRPKKLSKTNSSIHEVAIHAINFIEKKENSKIPSIVVLQPTSPLRSFIDIDKAIELFIKSKAEYVTSFSKTKPLEWIFYKNKDKNFHKISKNKIKNSQYLKQAYTLNGAIYIFKKNILLGKKLNWKNIKGIEIDNSRSVDIDNTDDFFYADFLLKKIKKN